MRFVWKVVNPSIAAVFNASDLEDMSVVAPQTRPKISPQMPATFTHADEHVLLFLGWEFWVSMVNACMSQVGSSIVMIATKV